MAKWDFILAKTRFIQRFLALWKVTGQVGSKLRIIQFIEAFWLAGTREFSPGEYWVYGFHLKTANGNLVRSFLPSRIYFSKVLPRLNNKKTISFLENKWLFFLHFKENGIRTAQCYGIYHPNSGVLSGGSPLKEEELTSFVLQKKICNFIVKPIAGTGGKDIHRVTVVQNGAVPIFHLKDKEYDAKSLLKFLADSIATSNNCGFLIQEYIQQHEKLTQISPSASMNIRIITLMRPSGEVVVTSASTRIGRSGAIVSNAGSGGLLARLDPQTGAITRCRSTGYIDSVETINHPDTGYRILDSTIPFWGETIQLCCNAARLIPDANSIGWDVLVNSTGPILLEGNHDWDVISEQLFGEGYLNDTNIQLLSEHGLNFPKTTAFSFRLSKVLQFIR